MTQYAKKVDRSQAVVVDALRKAGVQVVLTHALGRDCPDFLMATGTGGWIFTELKEADTGKLSRGQLQFLSDAKGHVAVVTNLAAALAVATEPALYALSAKQKERIAMWLVKNPGQKSVRIKKFRKMINA